MNNNEDNGFRNTAYSFFDQQEAISLKTDKTSRDNNQINKLISLEAALDQKLNRRAAEYF